MSAVEKMIRRAAALAAGQALPVRATSMLCADPPHACGISFIKMVSEDVVQAVAFGPIGQRPQMVTRWNPLSRDSSDLEPFARALSAYVDGCLNANELPRLWLGHRGAAGLLSLLGHRYRSNQSASPALRRMGHICLILGEELRYPDQQVIAVGGDLLVAHAVTGQTATEDAHLGSFLTWCEARPGDNVPANARIAAREPASAVLLRDADDRVEVLRRLAKRGDRRAEAQIHGLLTDGALREWELLCRARNAFWALGLSTFDAATLAATSIERMRFRLLTTDFGRTISPHSIARELEAQEHAIDLREKHDLLTDATVRANGKRGGRVLEGVFLGGNLIAKPYTVRVRSAQEAIRLRIDDQLTVVGEPSVKAIVRRMDPDGNGNTDVVLELPNGIRAVKRWAAGRTTEWVERDGFPLMLKQKVFQAVSAAQPPVLYANALPARPPRRRAGGGSLATAIDSMRRP